MWNGWIRFMLETYMELVICSSLQILSHPDTQYSGNILGYILSWLTLLACFVFAILIFVIPKCYKRDKERKEFDTKFGAIAED